MLCLAFHLLLCLPIRSYKNIMAHTCGLLFRILKKRKKKINYEWARVFSIDLELVLNYPRAIQLLAVQERHADMLLAILGN